MKSAVSRLRGLLLCSLALWVQGQQLEYLYSIEGTEEGLNTNFGRSISIDGGRILVGSTDQAYLFDGETGALLQTFDNPGPGTQFGSKVALQGDTVLVGDPSVAAGNLENSGTIYQFDANTGRRRRNYIITPSLTRSNNFFGFVLDIASDGNFITSGDAVVFGDNRDGTVFLYDSDTGNLIRAYAGPGDNNFGQTAAISDSQILAGGQPDTVILFDISDDEAVNSRAYANPGDSPSYGLAVDLNNDFVLIASSGEDNGVGVAYVSSTQGAANTKTLTVPPQFRTNPGNFGQVVAIDDNNSNVLVSEPFAIDGEDVGFVYYFDAETGEFQQRLEPPIDTDFDQDLIFGLAIGIDNNFAAVGQVNENAALDREGNVHVYRVLAAESVSPTDQSSSPTVVPSSSPSLLPDPEQSSSPTDVFQSSSPTMLVDPVQSDGPTNEAPSSSPTVEVPSIFPTVGTSLTPTSDTSPAPSFDSTLKPSCEAIDSSSSSKSKSGSSRRNTGKGSGKGDKKGRGNGRRSDTNKSMGKGNNVGGMSSVSTSKRTPEKCSSKSMGKGSKQPRHRTDSRSRRQRLPRMTKCDSGAECDMMMTMTMKKRSQDMVQGRLCMDGNCNRDTANRKRTMRNGFSP